MPSGAICKWVVFVVMAVSTLPTRGAPAAKTAATRQAAAASVPVPATAEDITLDIEVQTSRANPVVGSDLGITAVFKNTSKRATLYLGQTTTTMTLPPEMEGPLSQVYGREAFFPSENDQWLIGRRLDADRRARQKAIDEGQPEPPLPETPLPDIVVAIQPGHSYRAMWVHNMATGPARAPAYTLAEVADSAWTQIMMEMRYLFFSPGDYKILVQAKVGANKLPTEPGYYTFSQVATIKAGAPQFVIIFGAMIGGLACWLLFPGQDRAIPRDGSWGASLWKVSANASAMLGVFLYAAIITILMARLSESQFLVKISVTDFWGAVVVGFIAQYVGKAALDKYLPGRGGEERKPAAMVQQILDDSPGTAAASPNHRPGFLKRIASHLTHKQT